MNWKIDPEGLEKARDLLELTYPVRVRVLDKSDAILGMAGKYHGLGYWGPTSDTRLDEPVHHISLNGGLSRFMANECLWHELTHAAQAEDFLPDDANGSEPYQVANRGLRMAFAEEMRAIRAESGKARTTGIDPDYADVSFEKEAREMMRKNSKIDIIVGGGEEKTSTASSVPLTDKDGRYTWRVDMWDHTGKNFVDTTYVWAKDEWDAKKWARENYMDGMKWSTNLEAHKIYPRKKEGVK